MIYWPITPGAEFTIAFPNNLGLKPEDLEELDLYVEIRNDVGLWTLTGSGWDFDATPGWILVYMTNPDEVDPSFYPPEGEYTYEAHVEHPSPDGDDYSDRILSRGLMVFGDYKAERKEYDKEIYYQQYGEEIY